MLLEQKAKEGVRIPGQRLSIQYLLRDLANVNTNEMEPRHEKICLWEFPTRSDSNRPAQL